jgi:hypothetical protein
MSLSRTRCGLVAESACTLAALFICSLVCVGQTTHHQTQPSARQTTLKEVLSWLPDDTETIIGAGGPFPLPDLDGPGDEDARQPELTSAKLDLRMRSLPLGLFAFKNGGLPKRLRGKVVALALEGSRQFRPPTALGEMRYEGCEIVVFDSALTTDRDPFMRNARLVARVEDVAGVRIAVFEEKVEDDTWTTFVAFPLSNIVLVATNMDYLHTVLVRMSGAIGPRALPETLPKWKYVNTRAPAWGLRHYQKLKADFDPSSPFSGQHAANVPDESAVGLTFSFEPAVSRVATVTYLSANKNSRQILQDYLGVADADSASPREFQIRLRQPAPDVTEGSVSLSLTEALDRFLFGLIAMLGHAVYV